MVLRSKLPKKKRLSAIILSTELLFIQRLISEMNYGYALKTINEVCERLDNYDWDLIRKAERS